jgi:ribonuclease HI
VLSPFLFITYVDELIALLKAIGVSVSMYADDLAVWSSAVKTADAERAVQAAADVLHAWADQHGLKIATPKCGTTVFTLNPHEAEATADVEIGGVAIPPVAHPRFLGVTLDRTLTFRPHADKLAADIVPRMNALRRLAGRTWGQSDEALKTLYRTTVESKAAYGSSAYALFAAQSTLDVVNRAVANPAARIITGCVRATPTGPLLAEAGIRRVESIAEERAAIALERAARTAGNPLGAFAATPATRRRPATVVNTRQPQTAVAGVNRRLGRRNMRDVALSIVYEAGILDQPREMFDSAPISQPSIRPTFHSAALPRSNPDDSARRTHALCALESLPETGATLWTDGSVRDGGCNIGGAGFLLEATSGERWSGAAAAGRLCSSFRAETIALRDGLALALLRREHFDSLRVCTDSLSVLQHMRSAGPLRGQSPVWTDIWRHVAALECPVQFVHVPAHVGVDGNEAADKLAKEGTTRPQHPVPLDLTTARAAIRRSCLARARKNLETRESAAASTAHDAYFRLTPAPALLGGYPRCLQTAIHRLRVGKSMLVGEFRYAIGKEESPRCPECGAPRETVEHFLVHCPALARIRHESFTVDDPTLAHTLTHVAERAAFLRRSGRISA